MSYRYQSYTPAEIEVMADTIRDRYPLRCSGFVIDIEGIIEDTGITILPRQGGLYAFVHAYAARNPRYIVTSEKAAFYPPLYRPYVAEEFCHIALEYEIFTGKELPDGADGHQLTPQTHQAIEKDAKRLALAVLLPKDDFTNRFNAAKEATSDLKAVVNQLEGDFQVGYLYVAHRACDLGLMTDAELTQHISSRVQF